MKDNLILIIKGFIIGIAKIIPGVSGSLLAISLNVYNRGLDSLCNFFKNKSENFKFLFYLGLGLILAIIFFSKIIIYLLDNYYFITMMLFIGLIIGGFIPIVKNISWKKDTILIIFLIMFIFLTLTNIKITFSFNNLSFFSYFIGGIFEAAGTVIPGLSSTALLLLLGIYENALMLISDYQYLIDNLFLAIIFLLGLIIGLIICIYLINYTLKKHPKKTYTVILGISFTSLFVIIKHTISNPISTSDLITGIIMLVIGFIIAVLLDK